MKIYLHRTEKYENLRRQNLMFHNVLILNESKFQLITYEQLKRIIQLNLYKESIIFARRHNIRILRIFYLKTHFYTLFINIRI